MDKKNSNPKAAKKRPESCSMLGRDELALFDSSAVEVEYGKGDIICKKGSFSTNIMYLARGLVKINAESGPKSVTLRIIPPDEFIELSTLYGDNTFPNTVIALKPSVVYHIDKNAIMRLIEGNGRYAAEMIRAINNNKLQIIKRMSSLAIKQAHGRLADMILYMANDVFKSNTFDALISRKEMAELTGLAMETVVRILKEFDADGLIKMDGKKISINHMELLTKVSEVG